MANNAKPVTLANPTWIAPKMMLTCFAIFAVIFAPAAAIAKSAYDALRDVFSERVARFDAETAQAKAAFQAALAALPDANNKTPDEQRLVAANMLTIVAKFGTAQGAHDAAQRSAAFFATHKSSTEYQYWANDQIGQLKAVTENAQSAISAAKAIHVGNGITTDQYIKTLTNSWFLRAYARGAIDEFEQDDRDFGVYYAAKSDADHRAHNRLVGILGSLGAGLQAASPPPPTPPARITCSQTGRFTNCQGQ